MYCKALHKSAVHPSIDFSYEDEEVNPDPIAQSACLPLELSLVRCGLLDGRVGS